MVKTGVDPYHLSPIPFGPPFGGGSSTHSPPNILGHISSIPENAFPAKKHVLQFLT